MLLRRAFLAIAVTLCSIVAAPSPRGLLPAAATPLPALSTQLVLDGILDEWGTAVSVPLVTPCNLVRKAGVELPARKALDFGAEVRLAWTAQGLCLAVLVADSQVMADSLLLRRGRGDMVEVFFDVRGQEAVGRDTAARMYHVAVGAPAASRVPVIAWEEGQAWDASEVQAAGRFDRDKGCWSVELMIAWPTTFVPAPGSKIGLEVSVSDMDSTDDPMAPPVTFSRRGQEGFERTPGRLARWELVERWSGGQGRSWEPLLDIDIPLVIADPGVRAVSIYLAGAQAQEVSAVRLAVRDSTGRAIYDKTSRPGPLTLPWEGCTVARFPFDTRYGNDGRHQIEVQMLGSDGNVLGIHRRGMIIESRRMARLEQRLRAVAPLRGISGELRRTQEWLAAAAAFERYRAAVRIADTALVAARAVETDVRLASLDKRPVIEPTRGTLYDLLRFNRPPEVIVEFDGPRRAFVSLYCGSVPLAGAMVTLHNSRVEAMAVLRQGPAGDRLPARDTLVGGQAATVVDQRLELQSSWNPAAFDPARHVTVVRPHGRWLACDTSVVLRGAGLDVPSRLVVMPGIPENMRLWASSWAGRTKRTIAPMDSVASDSDFVLVGDIRDTVVGRRWSASSYAFASYVPDAYRVAVCVGNRSYVSVSGAAEVSRRMISLILANLPITEEDVDGVRQMIVRTLGPSGIKPAAPTLDSLFCGDVQVRTRISQGGVSAAAAVLQALYANLDFAVLSDRNTVWEALEGYRAARINGVLFCVMAGQEVATDSARLNVFPLHERFHPVYPLDGLIEKAHSRGALVVAVSPGNPPSAWGEHLQTHGLTGTGLDGWQHIPPRYGMWYEAGLLPALVGSAAASEGVFGNWERTVVLAINSSENKIVEAIRESRSAIVNASAPRYFYGPKVMERPFWAALAEGSALKRQKAAMLRNAVWNANLTGLIARESSAE